jgi:hypothetical protein
MLSGGDDVPTPLFKNMIEFGSYTYPLNHSNKGFIFSLLSKYPYSYSQSIYHTQLTTNTLVLKI